MRLFFQGEMNLAENTEGREPHPGQRKPGFHPGFLLFKYSKGVSKRTWTHSETYSLPVGSKQQHNTSVLTDEFGTFTKAGKAGYLVTLRARDF